MTYDEIIELSRLIGLRVDFWATLTSSSMHGVARRSKRRQPRKRSVKRVLRRRAQHLPGVLPILPWERLSWEWHAMPKL